MREKIKKDRRDKITTKKDKEEEYNNEKEKKEEKERVVEVEEEEEECEAFNEGGRRSCGEWLRLTVDLHSATVVSGLRECHEVIFSCFSRVPWESLCTPSSDNTCRLCWTRRGGNGISYLCTSVPCKLPGATCERKWMLQASGTRKPPVQKTKPRENGRRHLKERP